MTHQIADNETARVEIGNSINEGSGGPTIKLVTFSPEKDGDNNKPAFLEDSFTVSIKDVDGGGTADVGPDSDDDVFPIADQTRTFPANSGNGTPSCFTTNTRSDGLLEGNETVLFDLVPSRSHIGVGTEVLKINDAQSVTVSFSATSDTSFENAQSGDKFVDVILNLPQGGSLDQDIVVPVTIGGTARIAENPTQANNDGQDDFTIKAPALPISNNVQNITFPAGSTNNTRITYQLDTQSGLRGDAILEGDETVRLSLAKPRLGSSSGTEVGTVSGGAYTLTIRDDEQGTIKVERVSEKISEGAGNVQFKFTVTPTGGSSISGIGPIVVPYTLGGTTLPQVSDPASDYFKDYNQGRSSSFTIGNSTSPVFDTSLVRTLSISLTDDNVVEGDETVSISLGGSTGLSTTGSGATTTITDNDTTTASVVVVNSTSGGDTDAKEDDCAFGSVKDKNGADCTSDDARFKIELGAPVSTDVRVELEATGTATSNSDYRAFAQFITIPAGKTSSDTFTLEILDDQVVEPREEIGIKIKEVNKDFGDQDVNKGTVEQFIGIADTPDSGTLNLTASDPIARESSGGVDNGQFLFQLSKQVGVPVVVTYTVSGDATEGVDYLGLTRTATIAPNSFATAVNVQVIDDGIDEGDENVTIQITSVSASGISVGTTGSPQLKYTANDSDTVTITDTDDDVQVSVIVKDGSAGESPSPTDSSSLGQGQFEVKLSNASADQVKVKYEFKGSASAADFISAPLLGSGELIFAPGSTSQVFTYTINNDLLIEGNETLILNLKDPTNAALGTSSGTITITDNDSSDVLLTAVGPTAEAGVGNNKSDSANPRGRFQFSVNDESTSDTTVFFTLGGLAENGTDYTIYTEDPTTKENPAVLSLSGNSGSIVLPKNSTAAKQLWVVGKSDNLIEGDEPVTITLNGTSNGSIKAEGSKSILIADDDSALVSLKEVDDKAFENSSAGGTTAQFLLDVNTTNVVRDMQVQYTLISTSSKPAATQSHGSSQGDVTIGNTTSSTQSTGFITVPARQSQVLIPISVFNDSLVEGTEELTMQLTGIVSETTLAGVGFDPGANNATAEIVDDDTGAQVFLAFQSSNDTVANEENANDTVPILVGLTQPSSRDIPVTVTVGSTGNRADAEFSNNPSNDSGIGHDDFWITASKADGSPDMNARLNPTLNQVTGRYEYQIVVPEGSQTAVVHVVAINDNETSDAGTGVVEGSEFVNIRLAENAAGTIYANSLASSEINPQIFETDKAIIRISDHDSTTNESGSSVPENTDTEATITLGTDVEGELDVFYRYTNGTAVAGSDFNGSTGSYRFVNQSKNTTNVNVAPSQPLKIDLINDGAFEGSEKFKIELFAQHNNGGFTDQTSFGSGDFASVQILDDDQIAINVNSSVTENNTNLAVAVSLNGSVSQGNYQVKVEGVSATAGTDFDAPFPSNNFTGTANWNGSVWSSNFDTDNDANA